MNFLRMRRSRDWPHVDEVVLLADAISEMRQSAQEALPSEIGGILIGWRIERSIRVTTACTLGLGSGSGHSYVRPYDEAAAFVKALRDDAGTDNPLGYVGEWHSHPASCGASQRDKLSLVGLSAHLKEPIALVVLMNEGNSWIPQGMTCSHKRFNTVRILEET